MTVKFKLKYKHSSVTVPNEPLIIMTSGIGKTVIDCIVNALTKTKVVTKGYQLSSLEVIDNAKMV